MTDEEFAEWLADEMGRQGLTRKELAEKSGLSVVTIGYYLTEKRSPTMQYVKLVLDALGKRMVIVDK